MTIHSILDYLTRTQRLLKDISRKDSIPITSLWVDSIWSFVIYGCTIRQYSKGFYRFSSFERNKVFTFRKFRKLVKKANDSSYVHFLKNKDEFNVLFCDYVSRHWLISQSMTRNDFDQLCDFRKDLILKPLSGMEGKNISIISKDILANLDLRENCYKETKQGEWIIEEVVRQHDDMCFGNSSVNTVRAVTIMDKKTGEVKIVKTVLRVGVGDSIVDNFHQGGCVYDVDIDSGRISSKGISSTSSDIIFHPGTNICMLGRQIPKWQEVISVVINSQKRIPQCRYISWDIAITDNGIELIEGNHDGDYDMLEFVGKGGCWPVLKQFL